MTPCILNIGPASPKRPTRAIHGERVLCSLIVVLLYHSCLFENVNFLLFPKRESVLSMSIGTQCSSLYTSLAVDTPAHGRVGTTRTRWPDPETRSEGYPKKKVQLENPSRTNHGKDRDRDRDEPMAFHAFLRLTLSTMCVMGRP